MTFFIRITFLICAVLVVSENASLLGGNSYPADVMQESELETDQLIRKYNYPVENHYITTEDNYILRVHRIPNPGGKTILLQHGLLDSSATFILMGKEHSLGYFLYDRGYDVWMGNARGNRYSRNHTKLSPDTDEEFWNFSWHEIGIYDIPAMIDYILEETHSKKVFYIGHSQGTTSFFVMCSMRPEYNEKIILAHAMAPVAFMKHIKTPLIPYADNYLKARSNKPNTEFMPNSKKIKAMCLRGKAMEDVCLNVFFMIMGKDTEQFNRTTLPVVMSHLPAGASLKQVLHYQQLMASDKFRQYDYEKDNQKVYGQSTPPDYELEKVTAPVVLHWGRNDYLSAPVDVQRLGRKLPNKVEDHEMESDKYNHIDFLYAINAHDLYEYIEKLNKKVQ